MSAFRRVLLCYDATREGQRALKEAAVLAQELRAEVHVLSILSVPAWTQGSDVMSEIPLEVAGDAARSLLAEGLRSLAERGIHAVGHFATGKPLDQIPHFAHELDVDLIVVGHRRCSRIARWWSGANDGQLLDRVSCSVLVATSSNDEIQVRTGTPPERIEHD